MTGYFLIVYPDRIGLVPLNESHSAAAQWRWTGDLPNLTEEPALLANLVRELTGNGKSCSLHMALHPGLYRQIMFSHTTRSRRDLQRLRRAELETVLRQKETDLFTYDFVFHNPESSPALKERRLIYALARDWVALITSAFAAQGMKLCRVIPLDLLSAESALRPCVPADRSISLCLTLSEECVSAALLQDGHIAAMRTDPLGLSTARNTCDGEWADILAAVYRNGIEREVDTPEYAPVADALLRMLGQLAADSVKMLHAVFGSEARIDRVLLCGGLAKAAGVKHYFDTIFEENCLLVDEMTVDGSSPASSVPQKREEALTAAAVSTNVDLLQQMRCRRKKIRAATAICALLSAVCITLIAAAPVRTLLLQREQQALAARLSRQDYALAADLLAQRDDLLRQKKSLDAAVESLPHSQTDIAGIIRELTECSTPYGAVRSLKLDCTTAVITMSFTAGSYDALIDWQRMITDSPRFQLLEMPTFTTGGTSYAISAKLTAADFLKEGAD